MHVSMSFLVFLRVSTCFVRRRVFQSFSSSSFSLFAEWAFIDVAQRGAELGGKPRPGSDKTGDPIFSSILDLTATPRRLSIPKGQTGSNDTTTHATPHVEADALAIWPLLQFRVAAAEAPTGAALHSSSGGLGMTPLELAFPHMADIVIPLQQSAEGGGARYPMLALYTYS